MAVRGRGAPDTRRGRGETVSGWRIEPAEVAKVLKAVLPQAKKLTSAVSGKGVSSIPENLTTGKEFTARVPAAMVAFLQDQSDEITSIFNHVGAGVQGVTNATIAYQRGQSDMVGTFNREMHKAARTGDFGDFNKHGAR